MDRDAGAAKNPMTAPQSILERFRQGVVWSLVLAIVVYVGYAASVGAAETTEALRRFPWVTLAPLLLLSAINYGLRFLRWELYLRRLSIAVPVRSSGAIFLAGLAMTVTPGKVGEFLKSWLLFERHGVPMARSAPVVLAERLTDLLALVLLASFGASSFGGPLAVPILGASLLAMAVALIVVQREAWVEAVLTILGRLPPAARFLPKLREAADSARAVLSGRTLILGVAGSLLAWIAECWEYQIALAALGFDPGLPVALFGYSFSTVAGVVSPGGLGPTDVGLIEIAVRFTPGLPRDQAMAAAFVTRLCTLWFAVVLGAIALLGFRSGVEVSVEAARSGGTPGA